MSDISELREWANNKIKLYDKMAVEAPHLYASDVSRSMLHQVVELCNKTAWHYPAKGELPDKDVECLVHTKSGNNFIAMIDSSDNCWCTGEFFGEYLKDDCVTCWQYIVPPKEEDE